MRQFYLSIDILQFREKCKKTWREFEAKEAQFRKKPESVSVNIFNSFSFVGGG